MRRPTRPASYLVVLEGAGTLQIDGTPHPIGPGSVVYLPADAETSYTNGPQRLRVLQVFAGPTSAGRYDWTE